MPSHPLIIANRGEIACRIIRTARRLGLSTLALFTSDEAGALHVALADRAMEIPSYLDGPAIIAAALGQGGGMIHPGYGFLSENAAFARAVTQAGLTFIGPPADAMAVLGDKAMARDLALSLGIAVIPGWQGDLAGAPLDYPVLLKARHGGGGRGQRIVLSSDDLSEAMAEAQREARAAFGDDALLAEKLLIRPRHVEAQILADGQGAVWVLGLRDCSLQRRRQKMIEECPAPDLSPALVAQLEDWSRRLVSAAGYANAGTVEFLLAGEQAYFIEMNTRLQVEHTVTEQVFGLDLVEWQIALAQGAILPQPCPFQPQGHAIQARLCAEDPWRDFLPAVGRLTRLDFPDQSYLRVESGFVAGDVVGGRYDSLLAKLIVSAADRPQAQARIQAVLAGLDVRGVCTNRQALADLIAHPAFLTGAMHTELVGQFSWGGDDGDPWLRPDGFAIGGENAVPKSLPGAPHPAMARTRPSADPVVRAPMPGRITALTAREGDMVQAGQTLMVMEAMKMEHRLTSPMAGQVTKILAGPGDQVGEGQELACLTWTT